MANCFGFSIATGKLGTDEFDEPAIDTPVLTEAISEPQYSIDSIKEDEEFGASSISVSNTDLVTNNKIIVC